MSRTPTRFTTVHTTHVTVAVNSADQARHALKELRHVKREIKAELRAIKAAQRSAKSRERRAGRRKPQPLYENFGDFIIQAFASLGTIGSKEARRQAPRPSADLAREVRSREKIIESIDAVKLQIEGKLVADAAPS